MSPIPSLEGKRSTTSFAAPCPLDALVSQAKEKNNMNDQSEELSSQPDQNDARGFDFLLGRWDTVARQVAHPKAEETRGRWIAETRLDASIIIDQYANLDAAGATGFGFVTLRTWCPAEARWEMTFLAPGAPPPVTSFTARRQGNEMHALARGPKAGGSTVEVGVRFYAIGPDHFKWEQRAGPKRTDPVTLTISAFRT